MEPENKEKKRTSDIPSIQTYTEDMVRVLEEDRGGLIKKIIKEQEDRETEKENQSPEAKKNKLSMIASLIFILLALSLLSFLFFREKNSLVNIDYPKAQSAPIIFTDKVKMVEVSGFSKEKIVESIVNEINALEIKAGGVEGIFLTEEKKVIGLRRFDTLLKGNLLPGDVNFVFDNFLMGVINQGVQEGDLVVPASKDFFILIKMRSFVDIFPVMRNWENKMFSDLHGLFGIKLNSSLDYLLTKDFEDGIVINKNARILYDNSGSIVLMYVFANEQSLIITNKRDATHEVMLRIASSRIKK